MRNACKKLPRACKNSMKDLYMWVVQWLDCMPPIL